jgi:hypothetical protein
MLRFLRCNPWIIAVLMLVLATLACDDYAPPMPYIDMVLADPTTAGRAYAHLTFYTPYGEQLPPTAQTQMTQFVYQTDDYGRTWRISEFKFPDEFPYDYPLTMTSQAVRLDAQTLWTFPRRTFRETFFYPNDSGYDYRYIVPSGKLSNSTAEGVIYTAMGTEGVLVGRFDGSQPQWDRVTWSLEHAGIDTLKPIKLTVDEPAQIAQIILAALLFPPLALIHRYILKRIWLYGASNEDAARMATLVSVILMVCAVLAILIWLTNISTDYYPMVAVMTVVTVLVSVAGGYILMQPLEVSYRRRLLILTALVALIVPLGVASIWVAWPVIIFLLWGYMMYRRRYIYEYEVYLIKTKHPKRRWVLDRLTLETVMLGGVIAGLVFGLLIWGLLSSYSGIGWFVLGLGIVIIVVGTMALRRYVEIRSRYLLPSDALTEANAATLAVISYRAHLNSMLLWVLGTVLLAGGVFFAQLSIYSWFQTLLR